MNRILEFYQPFVSAAMPGRFQWEEIITPLVLTALLAIVGTAPLLITQRWLLALLSVVVLFALLNTLQAGVLHLHAVRQPDGTLYISTSVLGVARAMSGVLSFLLASLWFLLLAWWTGWLQKLQG